MIKRIVPVCLLGAATVLTPLKASAADIITNIVNGSVISQSEHPDFVALFIDSIGINSGYTAMYSTASYCGGTILDDTHIMTAAHCVVSLGNSNLFAVVVTDLDRESDYPYGISNSQRYRVANFYYPDDYQHSSTQLYPNDIAILELETSISSYTAVNLPSDAGVSGSTSNDETYRSSSESFIAIGNGNTETGEDDSDELLQTSLNYVSNTTCANTFSNGDNLTSSQICFDGDYSSATGLKNATCQGDSGGPVYWETGGSYYQVGITSFGPQTCGDSSLNVTSVFTEVADYQTWITSVINGNETPKLTVTDQDRIDYLQANNGSISDNSSTYSSTKSSSGGAMGWGTMLVLLVATLRRRWVQRVQNCYKGS